MTIEHARIEIVDKPWGSNDLRPWSILHHDGSAIGELWFERAAKAAPPPALLLKMLFTEAPLSIQVHPDDDFARSIGLDHGKTEAWVILATKPGAEIAIGLKRRVSAPQLSAAIADGTIADLVQWRQVSQGDVIFVPAGTIHAIGAGLVIAEIQQRSDATFRLFDFGRHRELHAQSAVEAANARPDHSQTAPKRLTDERTLLTANPHFVLERIDLLPGSRWELEAEYETWFLVLAGNGKIGATGASCGEAVFLQQDCAQVTVGPEGLKGLLAYAASRSDPDLLRASKHGTISWPLPESPLPYVNGQITAMPITVMPSRAAGVLS